MTVHADVLLRAGAIHPFDGTERVHRALALRDGTVLAVGDDLDALAGPRTRVVDAPELTVLPGLRDTHNHQLWMARHEQGVRLDGARTIDDVIAALAERARRTPPGEWIVTSGSWHESALAERRLPTAVELDAATAEHPVLVRRGGHVGVANSRALALAGITAASPDPARGTIVRDADRRPLGTLIEPGALAPVLALLPERTVADDVDALAGMCAAYNAAGLTAVRDPGAAGDDLRVYQALRDRGGLTTRTRVMIWLAPEWDAERKLEEISRRDLRTGFGDDRLRLDGLKLLVDGGVEGAALDAPYATDPSFHGHLLVERDELARVVAAGLDAGWRIGCHAVGDRTLRTVLDVYEDALLARPGVPPGTLAVEHAFLADPDQRRRAIALGVAVTVQYPLLYRLAFNVRRFWGDERAEQVYPIREWVEEGAIVAAGSDTFVAPYEPLLGIWGMVTRETAVAGVLGPEHAVDRRTAIDLHTRRAALLTGDAPREGSLAPGCAADLVALRGDPLTCPIDDLPSLPVALTVVAGDAVHDPDGLFGDGERAPTAPDAGI